MRKYLPFMFFFVISFLNAQTQDINSAKPKKEFANQGEAEDAWSEEFFEKHYVQQKFEKFSGEISFVDNSTIKFDDKILIIWNANLINL